MDVESGRYIFTTIKKKSQPRANMIGTALYHTTKPGQLQYHPGLINKTYLTTPITIRASMLVNTSDGVDTVVSRPCMNTTASMPDMVSDFDSTVLAAWTTVANRVEAMMAVKNLNISTIP